MINERLRNLRNNAKQTQNDVANYLGISRTAYNNYESGIRVPDNEKLVKLADLYSVSVDYLLGRTDDPVPYKNVDSDLDQEHDFDDELKKLLKDEELAAFYDFANLDEASKKEIIQFIKFKKGQE